MQLKDVVQCVEACRRDHGGILFLRVNFPILQAKDDLAIVLVDKDAASPRGYHRRPELEFTVRQEDAQNILVGQPLVDANHLVPEIEIQFAWNQFVFRVGSNDLDLEIQEIPISRWLNPQCHERSHSRHQ